MNAQEEKTGIDMGYAHFEARQFITTDARQMAFDNYESLIYSQSGLAGAMNYQTMTAAELPRGFNYDLTGNGLGGTPSPIANGVAMPLVSNPDFADTFIRNVTGYGGSLY